MPSAPRGSATSRCGDSRSRVGVEEQHRVRLDVQLDRAAALRGALGIHTDDEVGSRGKRGLIDVVCEPCIDIGFGAELLDEVDDGRYTGTVAGELNRLGAQADRDLAGSGRFLE